MFCCVPLIVFTHPQPRSGLAQSSLYICNFCTVLPWLAVLVCSGVRGGESWPNMTSSWLVATNKTSPQPALSTGLACSKRSRLFLSTALSVCETGACSRATVAEFAWAQLRSWRPGMPRAQESKCPQGPRCNNRFITPVHVASSFC